MHPAPSPGPRPRPASDRAAAAATAGAAALGDPGPAGAAGGGGAPALDVPQRGGQREKGGRGGLGWGAAPLLMWRRVGGGRGARMEKGCRGWGGWAWVGVRNRPPLSQSLRDRGPGHRPSLAKALEIEILDIDLPLKRKKKIKGRGIDSRYNSLGKALGMGSRTQPPHQAKASRRPFQSRRNSHSSLPEVVSDHNNPLDKVLRMGVLGHSSPTKPRPGVRIPGTVCTQASETS